MPKVLLTGAGGQIATAIALYFPEAHIPTISLNRKQLDICSQEQLNKTFDSTDFDIVINCAAFTDTEIAEVNPSEAEYSNVHGIQLLANQCRKYNKFLIHISTNCIFSGTKDSPYTEDDAAMPLSVYGSTKYKSEEIIRKTLKDYIIFRTCWNFSEFEGHNFVLKILRRGIADKHLRIVDDQFGCPTSAHSVARALAELCDRIKKSNDIRGTYHFCSSEAVSWYEYSKEIFKLAKELGIAEVSITRAKTGEVPTNLKRPANGVLSTEKIASLGLSLPNWRNDLAHVMQKIKTQKTF